MANGMKPTFKIEDAHINLKGTSIRVWGKFDELPPKRGGTEPMKDVSANLYIMLDTKNPDGTPIVPDGKIISVMGKKMALSKDDKDFVTIPRLIGSKVENVEKKGIKGEKPRADGKDEWFNMLVEGDIVLRGFTSPAKGKFPAKTVAPQTIHYTFPEYSGPDSKKKASAETGADAQSPGR